MYLYSGFLGSFRPRASSGRKQAEKQGGLTRPVFYSPQ
jgi:hypothetical protein